MAKVELIASTALYPLGQNRLSELGYVLHHDEEEYPYESDADELAEFGGRLCYLSFDRPNPKTATNEGYLANIIRQKHESVLSHASASFLIQCSRACAHEIIRHRFLSFSEVSQRYVDPKKILKHTDEEEWVYEPELLEYGGTLGNLQAQGYNVKQARGEARKHLPLGFPTIVLASGNLRAWRDFIRQRDSEAADAEIREVAQKILGILREDSPNSVQDL